MNKIDNVQPVGKFAHFTDGVWREVTKGSAGVLLYEHPPAAVVQPVAWSVFDKRTQKHWYTNDAVKKAGYYAKEYSHREPDGSPSMVVVPLYEHPPAADVQELVEALQRIINAVPAGDGCGGFFIEHCDQDGNYIDTESVNPFDVALTLHSIAQEALAKWEGK